MANLSITIQIDPGPRLIDVSDLAHIGQFLSLHGRCGLVLAKYNLRANLNTVNLIRNLVITKLSIRTLVDVSVLLE